MSLNESHVRYPHLDPRVDRLRAAIAWDLSHEYVITSKGLHIRHVEGTYICDTEIDEDPHSTPYGGVDLCPKCNKAVPNEIRWVEPEPQVRGLSLEELCSKLSIELVVTDELPDDNDTGASPSGAILGQFSPPVLYVGHNKGKVTDAHRIGALHEIAHVVTSPFGFDSESGCGHYAVQYALGKTLKNNRYLLRSTKEAQGIGCPVYGGLMQARAWALGLLDEGRNVSLGRLGLG